MVLCLVQLLDGTDYEVDINVSSLITCLNWSLYLSVTPKFYTEVLRQTLNPTAELWCKTLSRIKVNLVLHRT